MDYYIKCFGIIEKGRNEDESLKPYYGKVLYSVSMTWISKINNEKDQYNFFIVIREGLNIDKDLIRNEIHLWDKIVIAILANCDLIKTKKLEEYGNKKFTLQDCI